MYSVKFYLRRLKRRLRFLDYVLKMLLIVVLLFVILEISSSFAIKTYYNIYGTDSRVNSEVYEGDGWVEAYYEEFHKMRSEYHPYLGYRRTPNFGGEFINLDEDSLRKTSNNCKGENPVRIFIFGGSTMWGTGARDEFTIASQLSDKLCSKGYNVEVVNFGESGYTSTQEMIRLELELREENIPNVVILYDGVNDMYASLQNGEAGYPQNLENRRIEYGTKNKFNIIRPLVNSNFMRIVNHLLGLDKRKFSPELDIEKLSDETLEVYENNLEIIDALSDSYGFEVYYLWQPTIFSKENPSDEEKKIADEDLGDKYEQFYSKTYTINNPSFYDISNVFDNENKTIYIDEFHTSEEGNGIIAERINSIINISL